MNKIKGANVFAKSDKAAHSATAELERKQSKLHEKIGQLAMFGSGVPFMDTGGPLSLWKQIVNFCIIASVVFFAETAPIIRLL